MPIEWRTEMTVDNGIIDDDHKFLIKTINTFETVINKKMDYLIVNKGLKLLKHYTIVHFQREEELQLHAQYLYYDAHIKEHKDLIKKLDTIIIKYEKNETINSKFIMEFLKDWLIEHIINSDLRMKPYVSKMRSVILTNSKPLKNNK